MAPGEHVEAVKVGALAEAPSASRAKWGWALLALLVSAALLFPAMFRLPYPRDLAIRVLLYAMLAQAWNILAGYCGQISLGHAVFFGAGAYTSSILQTILGWNPWIGLLAGAAVAVALSLLIGYPCFRLRGHYFAIATIAIGEIIQTLAINWDFIGGARGLSLPFRKDSLLGFQFQTSKYPYYYIILTLFSLCLLASWRIERTRLGYYFRAIREDPAAAQSVGISITKYKLVAMAISAAFVAAGGSFYAQYVLYLDPDSVFPLSLSILICVLAVVGGTGTLWGPLVGAALMVPLSEYTRIHFGGTGSAVDLLLYGGLLTAVAVFQPAGLVGLVRRWWRRGWRS
ncbi:MAG TPA: branched-chain amino acid ABC transporter permease [Candidatus Methylomirabilis sp.]|nr:branched-chain amino acid ABC transporter permease [Candidatus Methylomirabilis sp.]HSB77465.1 branched-chain amino acid ABC transporter permease [Candidatus Methylomirabilis sp.]